MSNPLTRDEYLRVLRAERTPSAPTSAETLSAASTAASVLAHERILRHVGYAKLAAVGLSRSRLDMIEAGVTKPTSAEAAALQKVFREPVDVLLQPNNAENRARLRKLI